jgi:hypothetical protein
MYVSLCSFFEHEQEGCPCRLNRGFTGGSATWLYGMQNFRALQGPRKLFDTSTIVTMSFTLGHCEMVQHAPGKWSDYASHRRQSAWQEEEDIRQAMIQSPWKSRQFLDDTCSNLWCSRDGPIPWPANSPDLTPPDFFVWVYIKSLVYGQWPQNEADFRQKITVASAHITPEMLCPMCCNLSAWYELCRVYRRGHVKCLCVGTWK